MAEIQLDGIWKRYPDGFEAVKNMDLTINDGEFMILVGPSGCGKSTALRMIAGLEDITEGDLLIGGERVNDLEPRERDIAMVFQNYALYPHMSVRDNMGFALKLRKVAKPEIDRLVNEAAARLEISHLLDRKPKALSGGQRQRVALGRAIVRNPAVFLMDEPLSNLDAKLRVTMRSEIKKLHQQLQTTFVYVTHDQTEALTMGDRIAIFNAGYMQQVGTPNEVYNRPNNLFVASFIGSPQMNLVEGNATVEGNQVVVSGTYFKFTLPKPEGFNGGKVVIGFRPEHLAPVSADQTENVYRAPVEMLEPMGHEAFVYLKSDKGNVLARVLEDQMPKIGDSFGLTLDLSKIHLFDPATGETVERGEAGEFCTKGYSVMLGYWNDEAKTKEAVDADGWMHTGDLAVMREDGYCNIVGRIKDMVIRGGENIYPSEVEAFLYDHPDIEDVSVIGVPDERYGEELAAWVRMRPGAQPIDAEAVREFSTGRIAHYKIPKYVLVVDEFPMTVTGKIRKVEMRERTTEQLGL